MRLVLSLACLTLLAVRSTAQTPPDNALMLAGTAIARGGNSLVYASISNRRITVRPGDRFEYDLFIAPFSAEISGAPDIEFDSGEPFRDMGVTDQNGERIHPNHVLLRAKGQWYHRVIPMDVQAGKSTTHWTLVLEGDTPGPYAMFADNIGVRHADGTWTPIYADGPLERPFLINGHSGYSQKVVVRVVNRAEIRPDADIVALVERETARWDSEVLVRQFDNDLNLAEAVMVQSSGAESHRAHIESARRLAHELTAGPPLSPAEMEARLEMARSELAKVHPLMKRYTAHLVGHAHIDFQWLWEWPETLDVCDKTFSQAIRFMDEFPGFTFTQSSSALYRAGQEHYPDLFRKIQQKVKEGRWEIAGGRVSEGDSNLISPESHARQFLLGQRYFREHFGKTATVGWEPDTFGHTWSFPQILKMGGLDAYYFGRGGQGKPLFWWEGPDGTRILSFDEIASGSWYDSNLDNKVLNELPAWKEKTGTDSIMWVYGVGNHGGGPTREQLQTAQKWMRTPSYPATKFSTATGFFADVKKDLSSKIPVVRGELDPRIAGVFTTHAELKRMNRDAENATATAETLSTLASLYGRPYPKDRFNELWYGISFNHHHDTVPGSAIHESYANNHLQIPAIAAEATTIADAAARHIAARVTRPEKAPYAVMAFNPLGWSRGGEVRFAWPFLTDDRAWVAVAPDGSTTPVTLTRGVRLDNENGEPMASFTASGVPGFGYRVYTIRPDTEALDNRVRLREEADRYVLENGRLRVTVRKDTGLVSSLFDVTRSRETIASGGAGNRLEIWHEHPGLNDAWVVREYTGHESLDGPATVKIVEDTAGRATLEVIRTFRNSSITQWIRLRAGADQLDLPVWVDWREEGRPNVPTPFLKVACDIAGKDLVARYEIPFADIRRPMDGKEVVALKSADVSGPEGGLTIINDSRHGHAAEGNTLRLSLVRTPNRLDPLSDVRTHYVNTALVPHAGLYGAAQVRRGYEWNQGLLGIRVPPAATGELPVEKSFMTVTGDTVVPTVLKRAEDDPGAVVLRFYEAGGAPASVTVTPDAAFKAVRSRWVNFIEDPLSGPSAGGTVRADLRGYEIRNLLLSAGRP